MHITINHNYSNTATAANNSCMASNLIRISVDNETSDNSGNRTDHSSNSNSSLIDRFHKYLHLVRYALHHSYSKLSNHRVAVVATVLVTLTVVARSSDYSRAHDFGVLHVLPLVHRMQQQLDLTASVAVQHGCSACACPCNDGPYLLQTCRADEVSDTAH